jgi:hypothetical protein
MDIEQFLEKWGTSNGTASHLFAASRRHDLRVDLESLVGGYLARLRDMNCPFCWPKIEANHAVFLQAAKRMFKTEATYSDGK